MPEPVKAGFDPNVAIEPLNEFNIQAAVIEHKT